MDDGRSASPPLEGVTQSGGTTAADYLALLRNRDFRNLALATVTSALGDWIGVLAILALTREILGDTRAAAFALGAIMAARVIPSMILGPVAGVFVDRWNRKRVLIGADIGRGIVMAMIPFTDEIITLLLATFVIEVMSALFAPAKDAVFPRLVKPHQLVAANQVNLIVTYGTLPLGATLYAAFLGLATTITADAGGFVAERPLSLPIWFNAASFLISAPLLARITIPSNHGPTSADGETAGAWVQLKEGLRFIAGHPVIRALIVGVMISFVSAGAVISIGEFYAGILNAGQAGFGVLVAFVGAGLLGGLLLSGPLTARIQKERLFAPGTGLAGVGLIATALMPRLDLACITGAIMGLGAGVSFIVGYTTLQERAVDAIRGRTFAAFHSGVRAAILGASVAAPTLVGILGPERAEATRTDAGTVVSVYPYQLGGVRITLVVAGAVAIAGAIITGRWLHQALEHTPELQLPAEPKVTPARRHGALIVFEGGDGAGKSTQIGLLREAVERAGHHVVVTREPGGTELGEQIRELLLGERDGMSDRAEALLYSAARAQHVDEVLAPALEAGSVVLCDRFVDSSIVYQGAARGLGEDEIAELNRWAAGRMQPDLTVLLDVDAETGLARAGEEPDRMEAAGAGFHRTVNAAYQRLAEADPGRYLVLDATEPVEELQVTIRDAVLPRLAEAEQPSGGAVDGQPSGGENDGRAPGGEGDGRPSGPRESDGPAAFEAEVDPADIPDETRELPGADDGAGPAPNDGGRPDAEDSARPDAHDAARPDAHDRGRPDPDAAPTEAIDVDEERP
jgi:dTMP kinase